MEQLDTTGWLPLSFPPFPPALYPSDLPPVNCNSYRLIPPIPEMIGILWVEMVRIPPRQALA